MAPEPTMEDLIRERKKEAQQPDQPSEKQKAIDCLNAEIELTIAWFLTTLKKRKYCIGNLDTKPIIGEVSELILNSKEPLEEFAYLSKCVKDDGGEDLFTIRLFSDGTIYGVNNVDMPHLPKGLWYKLDTSRNTFENIKTITDVVEKMRDRAVNIPYPGPAS